MKTTLISLAAALAIGAGTSLSASAQTTTEPQPNTSNTAITTTAAPVAPAKPNMSINARQRRQQARIRQGIRSGELTRGEAATLEKQEAAIQAQKLEDKAHNGGTLTTGERKQIQHELNHESRAIYRKKHNERVQKP